MSNQRVLSSVEKRTLDAFASLTEQGDRLLLAVSGGSDSMALLHLSCRLKDQLKVRIEVGFVDHGLRAEVDEEFELVREITLARDLKIHKLKVPRRSDRPSTQHKSLQEWAREERYRLLAELAQKLRADALVTAHTRNDQAETLILRLIRGTGLDGLCGIPPMRQINPELRVIRPLLSIDREELRDVLRKANLSWAEDPSNQNPSFMRVRVREEVLTLLEELQPGATRRIAQLASDVQQTVTVVDPLGFHPEKVFENLRLASGLRVKSEGLEPFPTELRSRIIRYAIRRVQGHLRGIERSHVELVEKALLRGSSTGRLPLPGAIDARVDRGALYLFCRPLPFKPQSVCKPIQFGPNHWSIEYEELDVQVEINSFKANKVKKLDVRIRRPGDRIWASQTKFKKRVNQWKIPHLYRDLLPVLAYGTDIISCPFFMNSRDSDIAVNWQIGVTSPLLDIAFTNRLK